MIPYITLNTERLVLRPLCETDVKALYTIFSDPAVMRYWNTAPWEHVGEARDAIANDFEARRTGNSLQLGVEKIADAQLIGTCTLFNFNHQCRRAELGYALARSAWGRGFMHEALSALIDYAFAELNLHRIEAEIDPRNQASAKTLDRLGFLREGHLRDRWMISGEVSDSDLYGLLVGDRDRSSPARRDRPSGRAVSDLCVRQVA
ncbi:GNAT family N-acetyltransferase [Leptolyngbya sp. CCNP1308]|uniref:GNAT family N-acetyltransferase n=1 Tax=Leptolyngbya sp. CCNP1308 TaxID=3110255 RepID=UPI002B201DBD|nr:GNAT family N-acetyltransferase [Leptolyngbya sp. CCNP1308]MEA5449564.1 GNAT family N-acetyltransferase [Leptolyngbya sp. CCNP1308]